MAVRRVSTRLAIEGDAQYKQAASEIVSQLKVLDSQLKLTASEYKNNANSLEALIAKSKNLSEIQLAQKQKVDTLTEAYKNAQASVKKYEDNKSELTQKIKENNAALEKLKNTEGDTTEAQKKLADETARLKSELDKNEAGLLGAQKGVTDYEIQINKAKVALNNTNDAISKNDKYLGEAKKSADGYATSIDNAGKEVKNAGDNMAQLGSVLAAAGVVKAFKALVDAMEACISASIAFESAMTGVAKTTDLTKGELDDMAESLQRLSVEIPLSAEGLAKIAEIAGQLGIEKENIIAFTRVIADLAVATNLTAEEAATLFAQFANITGMSQDDFDRLGSAIVDLGNNSATTEADITAMAMKLAAAGTQAGMSQADILGLAAALSSVGLSAEAGGSAFSKAINKMSVAVEIGGADLEAFAEIAGMSAEEFAKAYKDDATAALLAFIRGLGDVESHGKSATVLLEELGLTEVRLRDALIRASEASDLFESSIQRSNRAWNENSALSREAQLRYETTESKLQKLSNAFNNLKTAAGDKLSPALGKVADVLTKVVDAVAGFISNSTILVPLITGLAVAIGIVTAAVVTFTVVLPLAQKAMAALNATMAANPALLLIAAIAGLVAAVAVLVLSFDDGIVKAKDLSAASKEAVDSLNDFSNACKQNEQSITATAIAAEQYLNVLEELHNKGELTAQEQREYAMVVDELNGLGLDYNLTIDKQTGLITQNISAVRASIAAWRDHAIQQARIQALTEMYKKVADSEVEMAKNIVLVKKEQESYNDALKRHEAAIARQNELINELGLEAAYASEEYQKLEEVVKDTSQEMSDASQQLKENNKAVNESAENIIKLKEETQSYEDALAEMNDILFESELAAQGYTEAEIALIKTYKDCLDAMDDLEAAYNSAYNTARETIEGQIGLYDAFDYRVTMTAQDMIDIWNQQAENLQRYMDNLAAAADASIGLNEDIINAWSDGTKESAAAVQAFMDELNRLTELYGENSDEVNAFVDEFNKAYEGTSHAKDAWAETIAMMQTNFEEAMNQIQEKMAETLEAMDEYEAASAAAKNTCDGYLEEFRRREKEFEEMGERLGEAVTRGYNKRQEIKSPSRVAMRSAGYTVEGYLIPLEKSIDEFKEVGSKIAAAIDTGYTDTVQNTITASEAVYYNTPITTNNNTSGSYYNSAEVNIYAQQLGDAEINRLTGILDKYFGGKMTVNLKGQ